MALAMCDRLPTSEVEKFMYEQHIRPIFRAHCFDCHGATDQLEGGLDLRQVRLMTKGGESGPAIAPRQPDDSLLLKRILSGEMPPGESKVSAKEIKIIQHWLAAGATTARPESEFISPGPTPVDLLHKKREY